MSLTARHSHRAWNIVSQQIFFSVNGFRVLSFKIPDASGTTGKPTTLGKIVLKSLLLHLPLLSTQQSCGVAEMEKLCNYEVSMAFVSGC